MHPAQYADDNESKQEEDDERGKVDYAKSQINVEFYRKNLPVEYSKIHVYQGEKDQQNSMPKYLFFHVFFFK
jgi:hypothetical protein